MLRIKENPEEYVPLKQVNISAIIRSFAGDVTITQVFQNDETIPIEAVYCFPIEEQAAIYGFIAKIDDREIVAQLKEKKTAQQEYKEALQQGHQAYLLEQDEKSQDNFIINIGALSPGQQCQILISYVTELNLVENGTKIRFVVPTTIAPRYSPDKSGITSPAGTTSKYVQSTCYTIDFRCQVENNEISRINSISHPIEIDFSEENIYIITFAQENTHLDRDILLDIELAENRSNTIVAIEPGAIMASFTPNEADCQRVMSNEFVFLIDCSGSMRNEHKIELAQQAMLLFLKSLPLNCHFNIIRFGSSYQSLFKEMTVIYNEDTARHAERLIKKMMADLGGTELLRPLQWLEENAPREGRARQIFLLTDGEIENVNEVLHLCRTMATSTRIFSFGLGHSPSRSLVKGLARATNGRFVFIPPNTSVDVYVGEQLQKALQSSITNVQIKWNLSTIISRTVPTLIPPVYVNDRLIVYALIEDQSIQFDHNSSVELTIGEYQLSEAKVTRIPNVGNNETIVRLGIKALILELQHTKLSSSIQNKNKGSLQPRLNEQESNVEFNNEDETIKKRIIDLSIKYNILSPFTAFVGIEKRVNGSNVDMALREVPIQISADDRHFKGHSQMGFGGARTIIHRPVIMQSASYNIHLDAAYMTQASGCCGGGTRPKYNQNRMRSQIGANKMLTEDVWPTNNQDIVRYLIDKQKFDGSWDLDSKTIERLTGKSLTAFQQSTNHELFISAIVIIVLETRFASFSSMWYGVVQKSRKYLIDLLGNDTQKLDTILKEIRNQL